MKGWQVPRTWSPWLSAVSHVARTSPVHVHLKSCKQHRILDCHDMVAACAPQQQDTSLMRFCFHPLLPRAEAAEHDLVLKQLEPMDKGRRCYRMIGDVLVERTVAETLPAGRVEQTQNVPKGGVQ
jgi:hypothetical protein